MTSGNDTVYVPPMTLRDQLLSVAASYADLVGIKRTWLSTMIFRDGKRLDAIAAGRDLNTGTFERAMQWLSDNWPPDTDWPAGVARPEPKAAEAAE